jgi:hypothetical protein
VSAAESATEYGSASLAGSTATLPASRLQ